MKSKVILLILAVSSGFISLSQTNQNIQDTIYLDINDSSKIFNQLPAGYYSIDTINSVANRWVTRIWTPKEIFTSNLKSFGGTIGPVKFDTLNNKYIHWEYHAYNGSVNGMVYFRHNSAFIDSFPLTNNSSPVNYSDTFSIQGSIDTLKILGLGTGSDSTFMLLGIFQIRTEIRIAMTTDLKEQAGEDFKLLVYPNPCLSHLNIKASQSIESNQYLISDLNGRKVSSGRNDENNPIDVSHLNRGMYIIRFKDHSLYYKFQKL